MNVDDRALTPEGTISHELPFIDLVRAGASILVALSHVGVMVWPSFAEAFFSVGALGVDIFIIVSGFLMTISLCEGGTPKAVTRRKVISFYIRRYFRISPAFYVAFLLSLLLASSSPLNVLLHLTYLNGLLPSYADNSSIVTFWSISLEMQFYLFVPFLAASFRRANATMILAGCCLLNLIASQFFGIYGQPGILGSFIHAAFLPLSLGLFTTGIVLGLHFLKSSHAPSFWSSTALILCTPFLHPPFKHSCVAAAGALAVLCWLAPRPGFSKLTEILKRRLRFISRKNVIGKLLADYSYSLYLFHFFVVIWMSRHLSWFENFPRPAVFLLASTIVMGISYAISWFMFTKIERPGVWLGRKLQRSMANARWLAGASVRR